MGEYAAYRRKIVQQLLGIVYPPRCPVCDGILEAEHAIYNLPCGRGTGVESGVQARQLPGIHSRCRRALREIQEPACLHCGRPVAAEGIELCYDCRKKKDQENGAFTQGKALFLYQGAAKAMMYRFKYSGRREYALFFARAAQEHYGWWIRQAAPEVIIPVPMYRKKERRRGYNQAAVFARALSHLMDIPYDCNMVSRIRDTLPMKNLNDTERKNNLKNAFQISRCGVKYKRALLVDDIYTTGATADEVAKTLRQAGIDKIYFFSICIGKGI